MILEISTALIWKNRIDTRYMVVFIFAEIELRLNLFLVAFTLLVPLFIYVFNYLFIHLLYIRKTWLSSATKYITILSCHYANKNIQRIINS